MSCLWIHVFCKGVCPFEYILYILCLWEKMPDKEALKWLVLQLVLKKTQKNEDKYKWIRLVSLAATPLCCWCNDNLWGVVLVMFII